MVPCRSATAGPHCAGPEVSVPLEPMRGFLLVFFGLILVPIRAQDTAHYQPVFTNPAALRALQKQFDPGMPRLGPFGLPQPAAARFGWERIQADSSFAFDAARTLWLDYYCLFEDSVCADWALIRSPRAVRSSSPTYRWNERPIVRTDSAAARRPIAFESRWVALNAASIPGSIPTVPPVFAAASPKPEVPTAPVKPSELRIVVRSGDNFGVLQRRHPGVTLKELYAANKGSDRIYPGQVLKIPR